MAQGSHPGLTILFTVIMVIFQAWQNRRTNNKNTHPPQRPRHVWHGSDLFDQLSSSSEAGRKTGRQGQMAKVAYGSNIGCTGYNLP